MRMPVAEALSGVLGSAPVEGAWQLGIGDPTPLGWATTAAYCVAFGLCVRTALRTRRLAPRLPKGEFRPALWAVLAALLFFLGLNKQLDLQTWLTQVAKQLAVAQGWYARRRVVQFGFVIAVGVAGLAGIGGAYLGVRGTVRQHLLAVVGMSFLLFFVFVSAASFHHMDKLIAQGLGALRIYHVLEVGGIACVAFAAWNGARTAEKCARADPPAG